MYCIEFSCPNVMEVFAKLSFITKSHSTEHRRVHFLLLEFWWETQSMATETLLPPSVSFFGPRTDVGFVCEGTCENVHSHIKNCLTFAHICELPGTRFYHSFSLKPPDL